ncbi:MAG: hypothetical protein ACOCXQ_01710 [Patescibacteria group bacterium]
MNRSKERDRPDSQRVTVTQRPRVVPSGQTRTGSTGQRRTIRHDTLDDVDGTRTDHGIRVELPPVVSDVPRVGSEEDTWDEVPEEYTDDFETYEIKDLPVKERRKAERLFDAQKEKRQEERRVKSRRTPSQGVRVDGLASRRVLRKTNSDRTDEDGEPMDEQSMHANRFRTRSLTRLDEPEEDEQESDQNGDTGVYLNLLMDAANLSQDDKIRIIDAIRNRTGSTQQIIEFLEDSLAQAGIPLPDLPSELEQEAGELDEPDVKAYGERTTRENRMIARDMRRLQSPQLSPRRSRRSTGGGIPIRMIAIIGGLVLLVIVVAGFLLLGSSGSSSEQGSGQPFSGEQSGQEGVGGSLVWAADPGSTTEQGVLLTTTDPQYREITLGTGSQSLMTVTAKEDGSAVVVNYQADGESQEEQSVYQTHEIQVGTMQDIRGIELSVTSEDGRLRLSVDNESGSEPDRPQVFLSQEDPGMFYLVLKDGTPCEYKLYVNQITDGAAMMELRDYGRIGDLKPSVTFTLNAYDEGVGFASDTCGGYIATGKVENGSVIWEIP